MPRHGLLLLKVIPSTDITYLGAFRAPTISGFSWVQTDAGGDSISGAAYYPPNGTLLLIPRYASTGSRWVGEFSIPTTLVTGCTYATLATCGMQTSTVVHAPVDFTGTTVGGYNFLGDIHYLPAKGSQERAHLYWSLYSGYSSQAFYTRTNGQFAWTDTDLDNLNTQGMWRLGDNTAL